MEDDFSLLNNISSGNLTETVHLAAHITNILGPKRLPLNWLIPLTSVYVVIFLTGLIGNSCTCLVISRNQYMQTVTNCYLFNLALADMLTLAFAMPLELYTLWQQYPWELGTGVCKMRAIITEATANASILTIVTFSAEQYFAVCHPLRQTIKSKVRRAFRNIVIIWVLSTAAAIPYSFFMRINYLVGAHGRHIPESAWCGFPFNEPQRSWETLMLCSTFLFFVVPMTLISVLYIRIAMVLHSTRNLQRSERTSHTGDGQRAKMQSRKMVIKMLITVVIAFFVCWAPFHSQRLLFLYVSLYGEWTEDLRKINQDLFSLAGCFYYSNSTINPILYSVMSNRFRVAFREKMCAGNPCTCFLCCFCCCWEWWRDKFMDSNYGLSNRQDSNPESSSHTHHEKPVKDASLGTGQKLTVFNTIHPGGQKSDSSHLLLTSSKRQKVFPKHRGASLSEGRQDQEGVLHDNLDTYPRYKSDPNFPLRLTFNSSREFRSDAIESELAKDLALAFPPLFRRSENVQCDEVSCTNCSNLLFQTKSKMTPYHPIEIKSSNSGNSQSPLSTHSDSETKL